MSETNAARRRMRAATIRAVTLVAEDLAGRAQRLAPLEEGTLRASADVNVKVDDLTGTVTGEVSFNTIYAARQHEETEWRHGLDGQAKYLEQPLREMAPRYEAAIAAAIRRAL